MDCEVCQDLLLGEALLSCTHMVCSKCLLDILIHNGECPLCSIPITNLPIRPTNSFIFDPPSPILFHRPTLHLDTSQYLEKVLNSYEHQRTKYIQDGQRLASYARQGIDISEFSLIEPICPLVQLRYLSDISVSELSPDELKSLTGKHTEQYAINNDILISTITDQTWEIPPYSESCYWVCSDRYFYICDESSYRIDCYRIDPNELILINQLVHFVSSDKLFNLDTRNEYILFQDGPVLEVLAPNQGRILFFGGIPLLESHRLNSSLVRKNGTLIIRFTGETDRYILLGN